MSHLQSNFVGNDLSPNSSGWLGQSLGLPHRTLFQNEFVGLVLMRLKRRQELLLHQTRLILLTVVDGSVQLIKPNKFLTLYEGGQQRLEWGDDCEIRALSDASLLLFVPTAKATAYSALERFFMVPLQFPPPELGTEFLMKMSH